MEIVFPGLLLFGGIKIGDRKREDQKVEVQFVLELPLLAFFYHKHSNGLFNTKLFYSDRYLRLIN